MVQPAERKTEAATALINGGADVLMQNTDSSAVLQTAEKDTSAFGWDSDMTAYGPKAHLGSAVINWGPGWIKAVRDVLDGKWETGQSWWGVKEGRD